MKLKRVIQGMYNNIYGIVRIDGTQSENFKMEKGVKQGDSLSPFLFGIFTDSILKHCKRRTSRMKIGNRNLRPVLIQALVHVDDVLLISDKKEHLQNAVIEWGSTFQERGLEINTAKIK
jgi:hypothetical protein